MNESQKNDEFATKPTKNQSLFIHFIEHLYLTLTLRQLLSLW